MAVFTGVYQQDVKLARKLNLFSGINPKKQVLQSLIADYLSTTNTANDTSESQKISESDLADELIALCDTEKGDRPSLLPKPTLKKDRVKKPAPILKKRIRIEPDPLKRPAAKPIKRSDRKVTITPKPKLSRPNRNYI